MFSYAPDIRAGFPELSSCTLQVARVGPDADVAARVERHLAEARRRIGAAAESDLPEVQAWRRTFAKMGLKPTQYRCASEALLRRLRKEGDLPRVHPLVDLCNALSAAFAIPVAVFDLGKIAGELRVRRATGSEIYQPFSGETEHPEPGEIVFADDAEVAHARRWTNRQSGFSAVSRDTSDALIVAEAMHDTGQRDAAALIEMLKTEVAAIWRA